MMDTFGRRFDIQTTSGKLCAPVFFPDATRASVRGLGSEDVASLGISALVVNTYHLLLGPGAKRIARAGGVHAFMRWPHPILSDSGGYQIYSLIHKRPNLGRITEEGAEFRDERSGAKHTLSPEDAIRIQFDLGVDMMVVLDDPRPNDAPDEEIASAADRSVRWAARCREEFDRQVKKRGLGSEEKPLLFSVVQGGKSREIRKRCAEGLVDIGFDGYGFGARHVDENGEFLEDIVRFTASILPEDKPRFALGVGNPEDIVRCFFFGWDMFDCVIPTREGRHGKIFVFCSEGGVEEGFYETFSITGERFREDDRVIEESCDCPACSGGYSRAYLRHLFRSGEPLGPRLASAHNLRFYARLTERLKRAVSDGISRNEKSVVQ